MSRIDDIFETIDRADFLPAERKNEAVWDVPLQIGFGQTNSQPTTVRMMLEWLDAQPGDRVLDVGSGSGWTTALLAAIVGPKGRVYAVEKIEDLMEFGQRNVERAGIKNARFFLADERLGLPEHGPYDRILVSANALELPEALVAQLRPNGKLVVPVNQTLLEATKQADGKLDIEPHAGFLFVPLT